MNINGIITTIFCAEVSTRSSVERLASHPYIWSCTIAYFLCKTVTAVAAVMGVSYIEIYGPWTDRCWTRGRLWQDNIGAMIHLRRRDSRMWSCTFREFSNLCYCIGSHEWGSWLQIHLYVGCSDDWICDTHRPSTKVLIMQVIVMCNSARIFQYVDMLGAEVGKMRNFTNCSGIV